MNEGLWWMRLALTTCVLLLAAWQDIRERKIRNWVSATGAIAGGVMALFSGWQVGKEYLIGFVAALVVGILLWILGVFRAGDAKLYAALGALMGWRGVMGCFLWSMLCAGCVGLLILTWRGTLARRMKRLWNYGKAMLYTRQFQTYEPEKGTEGELPLAPFVALGCVLAWLVPLFS